MAVHQGCSGKGLRMYRQHMARVVKIPEYQENRKHGNRAQIHQHRKILSGQQIIYIPMSK